MACGQKDKTQLPTAPPEKAQTPPACPVLMQNRKMMFIGLIWAALAPLISVALIIALAWWLRRARAPGASLWATAVVLLPVAAVWWWDRAEYIAVCTGEGKPVIFRKAMAEGVFLNSGTSNSFGMRYLQEEGFLWIEAPSIYRREAWVRYERSGAIGNTGNNGNTSNTANTGNTANFTTSEIPAITARYEVREDSSQPFRHTSLSQTRIIDRTSGDVLAKAGSAHFNGGRMMWVLGAWGRRNCPSAMSSPEDFDDYYHLAKKTLR
ncbi:MAG: hypothetical protein H7232_06230 [Aeromicrobium sp.]|nr:hypothetical protein [Burkholderiales bacterium]